MSNQILDVQKVVGSLPTTLAKNTFYAVRVGNGYDLYLSDSTGSVAHRMNYDGWQEIKTVQNLNDLKTTGKYFINIDNNTNSPFNGRIYLIVENATIGNNERIIQTVYADNDISKFWHRIGYGANIWRLWEMYENSNKLYNIGGRNLLMATSKLTNDYYWKFSKHGGQDSTEQPRNDNQLTIKTSTTTGAYWVQYYQRSVENSILANELISGEFYTVSFEAKATTTTANYIRFFFRQYFTGGSNNSSKYFNVARVNVWQKFSYTFSLQTKHEKHLYWQFIFEVASAVAGTVDIRNIKFEKGFVATEYSPAYEDCVFTKTDGRNLLLNSSPNIVNSNYMYQFPLVKAPNVGDEVTVTIWGKMGENRTGIAFYNTQGYVQLGTLTEISDGVYRGTGKWDLPKRSNEVLTPNNTHLNIYFFPSTVTTVNRIDKIKMELGVVGTDYSVAMEEVGFDGSSGVTLNKNNVTALSFKKKWAKIFAQSPIVNSSTTVKHPFDRTKIISISYRIDTPNGSLVNNGLNIEVTNDEFRLNAMYIDDYYQNKLVSIYVEYEHI